jgi:hypothetical protein
VKRIIITKNGNLYLLQEPKSQEETPIPRTMFAWAREFVLAYQNDLRLGLQNRDARSL